jgi:hypothetical protein
MVVKPVYDLRENDLSLIALIRERQVQSDYFLIEESGKINGVTSSISKYFKWEPGFFLNKEVFIQNLVPSLYDFFASLHALKTMGRSMDQENFLKALQLT